ncbi:MAG: family 16 glycosylhydrolase [Myxococcota bacterium]
MTALAAAVVAGTVALGAWSLAHWLCAAVFLATRPRGRAEPVGADSVAVLIPAREEGERAARAARSALAQDHAGPVEVHVLLRDASDSAVPHLAAIADPRVVVAFTGVDAKCDKLNWAAARMGTRYVAILDADHVARPNWLRSSIGVLQATGAALVQGRRHPLSARGFYPLWDALHQHVGCELFNAAFTRLRLTVFFTGTTAVTETALLRAEPLRRCITEDVDLSYRLLAAGRRVAWDPHGASDEEVSPDLYSFLARRRRWANGHTEAFFRHARAVLAAPIGPRAKVQFLFHGVHYLIALPVLALHVAIGALLLAEMPPDARLAAGGLGVAAGAALASSQQARARIVDTVVAAAWLVPAAAIVVNVAVAALAGDFGRVALPIPGWAAAVGLAGFGQLGAGTLVAVVASWPIAFALDVAGVLLGLADLARGTGTWQAVARATDTAAPAGIRASWGGADIVRAVTKPRVALAAALLLGFAAVGYARSTRVEIADVACRVLAHDGDPWIVPPAEIPGYCDDGPAWTRRTSEFELVRADDLHVLDEGAWQRGDATFFCNRAAFRPDHVVAGDGGARITLDATEHLGKPWTSGDLAAREEALYGRFEAEIKPAKVPGALTAFFLYRFDPWQEIDLEFVGSDPTRLLLNVYYNPGKPGDLYNYGYRGTPVVVDLGFDATEAFHTYAIEWDPEGIRWFVDGRLVHARADGRPTPIPHLPMKLHLNLWPTCSEELAGPFDPSVLPAVAEFRNVRVSRRVDSPVAQALSLLDAPETAGEVWQDHAGWLR